MTLEQQESILNKVKEILKCEDVEVILNERSEIVMTPINNTLIASKGRLRLVLIFDNDDAVEYDEEAIARILAK
jgi:hypothetical protein